jgi:hybrid cluster-associated redox disulfide protein
MSKVTGETTIEEILEKFPKTVKIFMDMGIPCLVCGEPLWGTIREAASRYSVDLDEILVRINKEIE